MLTTIQWFFISVSLTGLLALVAILAPKGIRWKVVALGIAALFLPVSYLTANDLLSRPKPFQQELLQAQLDEAVVLSSLIRDGEDIFIWLQMEGYDEPRAYRLPWSEEVAVQLHKAQSEAEQQGVETTLQLPEGDTEQDAVPFFEVTAPPVPPSKQVDE